jgi:hypothetical protein
LQLGNGFATGSALVVLVMPLRRHHARQKPGAIRLVWYQFCVKGTDIPIIQDIADIKNNSANGPRRAPGCTIRPGNQPWRALKRRLVLLIT